ncbi:MAG TPA: DUF1839 family protein [Burkholderiales bacterium]|nr:DUF1839 family protein [Burkholderiales bacterium]
MKRVLALRPESHEPHPIHREGRIWTETNCYVDLWVELLHALGHDPVASLAFTLAIDFEGDQWTFFKFPLADLHALYGLDVQELAIWRPLAAHVEEQVGRGRPVLVEVDAWFLPDTAGTSYRREHWKTTVAVTEIDLERRHMGYFHNRGYYHVAGEDFEHLLRLRGADDARMLAPYVEFVKVAPGIATRPSLRDASMALLRSHLRRAPTENPFRRFRARLEDDLAWLAKSDLDAFHKYSFATLRQYGACFELAQTFLQWLAAEGERGMDVPIAAFGALAQAAKVFQFQLARAVSRRTAMDLAPVDAMAGRWEEGIGALRARFSR